VVINPLPSARPPSSYRFPRAVIAVAVRWYLRYGLSYRDVEELLAERGITVDRACRVTVGERGAVGVGGAGAGNGVGLSCAASAGA